MLQVKQKQKLGYIYASYFLILHNQTIKPLSTSLSLSLPLMLRKLALEHPIPVIELPQLVHVKVRR